MYELTPEEIQRVFDEFWMSWMALGILCMCVVNFLSNFFKDRT